MIQITGLRPKNGDFKNQADGVFFELGWRAPSIKDLFQNLSHYIEQVPSPERWNLFFTPCVCTANKREFQSSESIWFDLDGVDLAQEEQYIEAVCSTLGVARGKTGIVRSGRGLHFYVALESPIVDGSYFGKTKGQYKAVLEKVGAALMARDLPVKLDPSVWNGRQLMRLPGTRNRKPHKGVADTECVLLQSNLEPQPFDLGKLSGLALIDEKEQIGMGKHEPTAAPVLSGCEFLKHCAANPKEINEPEWYAALSIVARLKDGRKEAHALSEKHPGYSRGETEKKIDQAIAQSGPRTCKSIQGLWGACGTCPHWGKEKSPILIKDPNEIASRDSGFHHMVFNPKTGTMQLGKPDYQGLEKHFRNLHPYRCTEKTAFLFNGTHYVECTDDRLRVFADDHFKPECFNQMVMEFKELVWRRNVWDAEKWADSTKGKVNFKNGVLDLATKKLSDHSEEYGFRYVLPYDFDPAAEASIFDKYLTDVTQGSAILRNTLLEFCGYAITGGRCIYQKALLLSGEGENGKSTFIDILKASVGGGAYSALSFSELSEREARVALDGALFNITEETPSKIWDGTTFKNLVTGGELSVRRLFKNGYKFHNRAKLFFSCNALPSTGDTSTGFFRRFLIIPFNAKFSVALGNRDPEIYEKMLCELPGIFNLFMSGWERLNKQKHFTKENAPDSDLMDYQELNDPIRFWKKEMLHEKPGQIVPMRALYDAYLRFCQDNGYEKSAVPSNMFGKRLKALIPASDAFKVRRVDGKPCSSLEGYTIEKVEEY